MKYHPASLQHLQQKRAELERGLVAKYVGTGLSTYSAQSRARAEGQKWLEQAIEDFAAMGVYVGPMEHIQ